MDSSVHSARAWRCLPVLTPGLGERVRVRGFDEEKFFSPLKPPDQP
jgi:hypothetical protein